MSFLLTAPSWVNSRIKTKTDTLLLSGDSTWKGQPVINTLRVRLGQPLLNPDPITRVRFNQMMQASYRVQGTKGRDRVVFGPQAGSITKRLRSVIDFGEDQVRDVFSFSNTVPGKPFNHMQRIRITNFGREDVIRLRNVGRTIRFGDLERGRTAGTFVVPGVSPLSLEVLV